MCRNFCALPLAEVAKLMCGTKTTCGAITNKLPARLSLLCQLLRPQRAAHDWSTTICAAR
jgi:hypothetical protein